MTQAMRQSVTLPADEWLSLDQASRLTGESIRNLQRRASWELRSARQAGRQTLARKALPTSGKGKPVWYVHRSFDPTLARCVDKSTREERSRTALVDRFPQHKVEQAYLRAHWLRKWRSLCDQRRIGNGTEVQLAERIVREAKKTEGPNFPISMRSLQLWHGAYYRTSPDGQIRGVEGLIDRRGVEDQGDGKSTDAGCDRILLFAVPHGKQDRRNRLSRAHGARGREARLEVAGKLRRYGRVAPKAGRSFL